jgi:hypothetical protein
LEVGKASLDTLYLLENLQYNLGDNDQIGVDFSVKKVERAGQIIKVQIWDVGDNGLKMPDTVGDRSV